jgi:hypothetical protein
MEIVLPESTRDLDAPLDPDWSWLTLKPALAHDL